ncbi:MAG: ATP-binding protein [Chloroflexia bacterium]|nr:ATP-binding protein [Chloroflexia bacterium]
MRDVSETSFAPNGASAQPVDAAAPSVLLDHFADLVDTRTGIIGRVVGSEREPAGSHVFHFWAADDAWTLDVGHIVVAFSEEAAVIGVVDEPRRYSDLQTFLDDYFDRHAEPELGAEQATLRPEILVFTVNVLASKHLRDDVDSHRPVLSGPVWFATPAAIDYALDRDHFDGVPVAALLHTNGNFARDDHGEIVRDAHARPVFQRSPIWLDSHYLLGPEAGHANWTGQSGLATKTSHALFLISAVFQGLQKEGETVAALMFNVKGPDLLFLDKPVHPEPDMAAAYATEDARGLTEQDLAAYTALELAPEPFKNFRIFAPFKPGQVPEHHGSQAVYLDRERTAGALNTARDNQIAAAGIVYPILWQLDALLWQPHKVFERDDLDDKLFGFVFELRESGISSLRQFETRLEEIDGYFAANPSATEWRGHHKFTIQKAKNRLNGLPQKFGGLLSRSVVEYGALPRVEDQFEDQEIRVVDIAGCNTNVQDVLVSSVINRIWKLAEKDELGVDKVIIFVDELNKYAPSGGEGGLRDTLVDIAARGRHLNVVLFGAQQFRSKVDDEILGNCGTSLYGRVGDEELTNSAYRSLSDTVKAELLGLRKGRLLVRHAHFRAPLFGQFPHPPTIPGIKGHRIFNQQAAPGRPNGHVSDGLFRLLQEQMGNNAPKQSEVRTACHGIPGEPMADFLVVMVNKIQVERANPRFDAWRFAQSGIRNLRARDYQ